MRTGSGAGSSSGSLRTWARSARCGRSRCSRIARRARAWPSPRRAPPSPPSPWATVCWSRPARLAVLPLRRRPWRVWLGLSVAAPVIYLLGYERPPGQPSPAEALKQPLEYVQYVSIYVGRGLGVDKTTGALIGLIVISAFAAATALVLRHREDRALVERSSFWVGTGLYALGAALLTGAGRTGFRAAQAEESRYTTMGLLLVLATTILLLVHLRDRKGYAVAAIVLLAGVAATVDGVRAMRERGERHDVIAACTRQARSVDDPCLQAPRSSPMPNQLEHIEYLRELGWAGD